MGFDKLDKTKEQAVVTAIEKIIDRSRHEPGTSLNKIAADVLGESGEMTPELARRACEAYNKSKSVYTLQKRASEDRAEDFELIDADEVNSLMYGYHRKAASELIMPIRDQRDNIPELRKKLEKVAFDASEAPEPPGNLDIVARELRRTTIRLEHSMNKLRESEGMHKQASEDAIHRACQVMRRLQPKILHKIARLTVNRYGDDGVRLMKLIGAYIEEDLPLQKTANTAIFPLREPYPSIAIAIDEARAFAKTAETIKKTAEFLPDFRQGGIEKVADVVGTSRTVLEGGMKKLLDPALELMKAPIYAQMSKEHKKKDEEVFDAELRNQLSQLRTTQAFVDIAADDFIKDYPIDDTMQAYNNVVGAMPELLDEKYGPWLKSLVREQLVQGNVYDANTIKQLQEIGKEIGKGRIADIEAATSQLMAGEGSVLPGLDIEKSAPGDVPKKPDVKKQDNKAMLQQRERETAQRATTEAERDRARRIERAEDQARREAERQQDLEQRRAEAYLRDPVNAPAHWRP